MDRRRFNKGNPNLAKYAQIGGFAAGAKTRAIPAWKRTLWGFRYALKGIDPSDAFLALPFTSQERIARTFTKHAIKVLSGQSPE